jgi:hypothetical protein
MRSELCERSPARAGKKSMAGLVVAAVLSVCALSYGVSLPPAYYLVFNVSATVQGADDATDAKAAVPLKGYLVIAFNASDNFQDANLVIYGKDANTPKKQPVYFEVDYGNGTGVLSVDAYAVGDYFTFFDIWDTNSNSPFSFEGFMMGKLTPKNVGTIPGVKSVPSSLKGVFMNWGEVLLGPAGHYISGTGNMSATLNNAITKLVNDTGPTWTQYQILNGQLINGVNRGIKPDLQSKGYRELVLP